MQTQDVTAATPTATAERRSTVDQFSSEDFFKLLVTELQQQDPLEPTKTADMIGQVSQIRTIEQSQQLVSVLEQLSERQHANGVSELLGHYVEAEVAGAQGATRTVSGIVTGVRFVSGGAAVLELDTGETVKASDVSRVSILAPLDPAAEEQMAQIASTGAGSENSAPTAKAATASQQRAKVLAAAEQQAQTLAAAPPTETRKPGLIERVLNAL